MPRPPAPLTRSIKLSFDACPYWIFQAVDAADPNFADVWKPISRFARWWVADHGLNGDLRDVYGILQLIRPFSSRALKKFLDPRLAIELTPATLKVQSSFLPPTEDYEEFIVSEFGEQKLPIVPAEDPAPSCSDLKYAKIAVSLGMDPTESQDRFKVIEFFKQRRKQQRHKKYKKHDQSWQPIDEFGSHDPQPDYDPFNEQSLDDDSQLNV